MANGGSRIGASGVLAALGFAGMEELEVPVLAALATGDPLLLVGGHGSAKSALCRAVAGAMNLRFHAYDAGKALFEDVIGFPDPTSLAEGKLRYVHTPLSIWDREFVLVDELSRASPQMQNKWLEVVRARRAMGAPIPGLQHVWAAMNPLTYLGAQALDAALAGRFAWIVAVPEAGEMSAADVAQVVRTTGLEDAPLAAALHEGAVDIENSGLADLVERTRSGLQVALREHDVSATRYIQQLAIAMPEEAPLDGRRMSMLRRNLISGAAAARVLGRPADDVEGLYRSTLLASLPFAVVGAEVDALQLLCAHERAWLATTGDAAHVGLEAILAERSARLAAAEWLRLSAGLDEHEHDRVVARFIDAALHAPLERRVRAFSDVVALVEVVSRHPEAFPAEIVARLLAWYARNTGLTRQTADEFGGIVARVSAATLARPEEALAVRLALESSRPRPGHEDGCVDAAFAQLALPNFRVALNRRNS
ncbi:hypothetical protein LBMAG42_20000 [Deltaproteobacteria bacterium]|nr:hypothetical protein LBMAG42_20000 [Deltaproteobacteria bacterium]